MKHGTYLKQEKNNSLTMKRDRFAGPRRGLTVLLALVLLWMLPVPGTAAPTLAALTAFAENVSETETGSESSVTFADLSGLRGAVKDGSIQDTVLQGLVEDPQISYYKSMADECLALQQKKVDYALVIREQYNTIAETYKDLVLLEALSAPCGEIGFLFARSEKGDRLRRQMNDYLQKIEESGQLEALQDYWFEPGEKKTVDLPQSGPNGVLTLASALTSPPFIYISDEKYAGYEVELLSGFCQEYGYGIRVSNVELSGILAEVSSGKSDLAANCLAMTQERKEAAAFSSATAQPKYTILMRKETALALQTAEDTMTVSDDGQDDQGFWTKIAEGFRKTFLKEGRWRMILQGCCTTLLLTLFAGLLGILLGFEVYRLRVCKSLILRKMTGIFNALMGGTPMVVLLMVFYYVIFRRVDIPAFLVAVIAFGLNFSSGISEIYYTCISSIDPGQMEAALALGYSPIAAFRRFVFPQACQRAMPLIGGQIVALLKGTAVVGYISIQDLTKMGDIIRSRTYEAFIPLLAISALYFLMTWLIRAFFKAAAARMDPVARRRKRQERKEKGVLDRDERQ